MSVTDKDCDEALDYLSDTCDPVAIAKADRVRCEILCKRIRKKHFLGSTGTVAEREACAEMHEETHSADDKYVTAITVHEGLMAKRELRVMQIDVFRSQEASRRQVRP